MNRIELQERIDNLPLFEKRKVFVATMPDGNKTSVEEDEKNVAICKVGGFEVFAYPNKRYNLLQFNEVFTPIMKSIEGEIHGYLQHWNGFARLAIFPNMEQLKTKNGDFGIIAMNSVDLSSSIIVKFCVEHNNRRFTIPTKVAGLRKSHTGKAGKIVKDYISMMGKVQEVWGSIITEFPKYTVSLQENELDRNLFIGDVFSNIQFGKRMEDEIKKRMTTVIASGKTFTLWDLFVTAIDKISGNDKYKSSVHKQKKLDAVSEAIFQYSAVLNI